jgi:uncharacterized protein (DUF58 family)
MAAAVAGYACGWLLGYPELCLAAFGTLLALIAGVALLGPSPRLRVRREVAPARIARGDAALVVLHVTNTGRRATWKVTCADRCGDHAMPVSVPRLGARATRTSSYRLPTLTRGEMTVGPLVAVRGDPFGFFRREASYGERRTVIVRPRTAPLELLASGHVASLDGLDADAASSGTTTFDSLREYTAGDDLRHIHWRTSARAGTLMVRRLVDSSEPRTTVVLDTSRAAYRGDDFEVAVDIAASVAVAAATAGFPVHLLAGGDRLAAGRGRTGPDAILDLLALVQPGTRSLSEALDRLPRGHRSGSLTVVTGAAEPLAGDRIAAAASHYERAIVVRAGGRLAETVAPALTVIDAPGLAEFAATWNRGIRA